MKRRSGRVLVVFRGAVASIETGGRVIGRAQVGRAVGRTQALREAWADRTAEAVLVEAVRAGIVRQSDLATVAPRTRRNPIGTDPRFGDELTEALQGAASETDEASAETSWSMAAAAARRARFAGRDTAERDFADAVAGTLEAGATIASQKGQAAADAARARFAALDKGDKAATRSATWRLVAAIMGDKDTEGWRTYRRPDGKMARRRDALDAWTAWADTHPARRSAPSLRKGYGDPGSLTWKSRREAAEDRARAKAEAEASDLLARVAPGAAAILAAQREAPPSPPVQAPPRPAPPMAPRVPGAKLPTFRNAQANLLAYLASRGWKVTADLKVPRADWPDGLGSVWFKPQAVYMAIIGRGGLGRPDFKGAHTTDLDVRTMAGPAFLAALEGMRARQEGRPAPATLPPPGPLDDEARIAAAEARHAFASKQVQELGYRYSSASESPEARERARKALERAQEDARARLKEVNEAESAAVRHETMAKAEALKASQISAAAEARGAMKARGVEVVKVPSRKAPEVVAPMGSEDLEGAAESIGYNVARSQPLETYTERSAIGFLTVHGIPETERNIGAFLRGVAKAQEKAQITQRRIARAMKGRERKTKAPKEDAPDVQEARRRADELDTKAASYEARAAGNRLGPDHQAQLAHRAAATAWRRVHSPTTHEADRKAWKKAVRLEEQAEREGRTAAMAQIAVAQLREKMAARGAAAASPRLAADRELVSRQEERLQHAQAISDKATEARMKATSRGAKKARDLAWASAAEQRDRIAEDLERARAQLARTEAGEPAPASPVGYTSAQEAQSIATKQAEREEERQHGIPSEAFTTKAVRGYLKAQDWRDLSDEQRRDLAGIGRESERRWRRRSVSFAGLTFEERHGSALGMDDEPRVSFDVRTDFDGVSRFVASDADLGRVVKAADEAIAAKRRELRGLPDPDRAKKWAAEERKRKKREADERQAFEERKATTQARGGYPRGVTVKDAQGLLGFWSALPSYGGSQRHWERFAGPGWGPFGAEVKLKEQRTATSDGHPSEVSFPGGFRVVSEAPFGAPFAPTSNLFDTLRDAVAELNRRLDYFAADPRTVKQNPARRSRRRAA